MSKDFLKLKTVEISTYFPEHVEKGILFRLLSSKIKAKKIF